MTSSYGFPIVQGMEQSIDFAAVRAKLGMTQTQMAEELGVAQGDLSNWETGKHKPSKLARRALEAGINKLLNDRRARQSA